MKLALRLPFFSRFWYSPPPPSPSSRSRSSPHHHRRLLSRSATSTTPSSAPTPSGSPTPSTPPILKDDKNEDRIWMVPTAGGDAIAPDRRRRLLLAPPLEPRRQIHRLPLRTRTKARPRSGSSTASAAKPSASPTLPQDVDDFAWSPDSRRLVLVLRDASPEELEAAKEAKLKDKATPTPRKRKKTAKALGHRSPAIQSRRNRLPRSSPYPSLRIRLSRQDP